MILRKPYAFLIKHFRAIHLILTLILIGIASLSGPVVTFFNEYVQNGYRFSGTASELTNLYTPWILFLLIFLALAIFAALIVLMIHKKKPNKLYVFSSIYYIYLFIGLFIVSAFLNQFASAPLDAKIARSVRDVLFISYLPQFIFIAFCGIRMTGFNIKKFDFQNDVKEMGLDEADAQEFELNVNIDIDVIKRKIKRFSREFAYYLKENKFIVICVILVLVIAAGVLIYTNKAKPHDSTYGLNIPFRYDQVEYVIKDAMTTQVDYEGNIITKGSYYVVVDVKATNKNKSSKKMDYNLIRLKCGEQYFTPNTAISEKFADFSNTSIPTSLVPNREYSFALAYKIPESIKHKNCKLNYYLGTITEKEKKIDTHIYVNINSKFIEPASVAGNYSVGDTIKLEDTYLKNTEITVKDYEIVDNYTYEYESCPQDKTKKCKTYKNMITVSMEDNRHDNKLMILHVDYNPDKESNFYVNGGGINTFVKDFVDIEYKIGEDIYTDTAIPVTPKGASGFIALEVPSNAKDAEILQLSITIRDKTYYVNLKI